jgi:hypothetical protein
MVSDGWAQCAGLRTQCENAAEEQRRFEAELQLASGQKNRESILALVPELAVPSRRLSYRDRQFLGRPRTRKTPSGYPASGTP